MCIIIKSKDKIKLAEMSGHVPTEGSRLKLHKMPSSVVRKVEYEQQRGKVIVAIVYLSHDYGVMKSES